MRTNPQINQSCFWWGILNNKSNCCTFRSPGWNYIRTKGNIMLRIEMYNGANVEYYSILVTNNLLICFGAFPQVIILFQLYIITPEVSLFYIRIGIAHLRMQCKWTWGCCLCLQLQTATHTHKAPLRPHPCIQMHLVCQLPYEAHGTNVALRSRD